MHPILAIAALASALAPAAAPAPILTLDARDAGAGSAAWPSAIGPFTRMGSPTVRPMLGEPAVWFNGKEDAYVGPVAPAELVGGRPRTVELWVCRTDPPRDEDPMVAWGKRGGPNGTCFSFNWGANGAYGGATHWADDLGWGEPPSVGTWRHLVYTYDGSTVRLYENTAEKASREIRLDTAPGQALNLAAQNGASGRPIFVNEWNGGPQSGRFGLGLLRIYTTALSPAQVRECFASGAARFHATPITSRYEETLAHLRTLRAGGLTVQVSEARGFAVSLKPSGSGAFDFLPADRLRRRCATGFYHLGDWNLRVRTGAAPWQSGSSARTPDGLPVEVSRQWTASGGALAMRFTVRNRSGRPVEIGAFGAPMVFNNILSDRSLDEAHERCSFSDPYIGSDAGYLQVTRLSGKGPVLLVLPERGTPFEAYRPLRDDPTPQSVTFEGFYEWMVHSRAYAEGEWKGAEQWNRPTGRMLAPGATTTYGFRFVLAPSIRSIEPTLARAGRPVAVGIPGYVVATDEPGLLFLRSSAAVAGLSVTPPGRLRLAPNPARSRAGLRAYTMTGLAPGRCRITVSYAGGEQQQIHAMVMPPAAEQVRRLGRFHADKQWYDDASDPFGRAGSFMPFSRETGKIVLQHSHVWMVGESDEMGAGPAVAMAMKSLGAPDPREVALLEQYVDRVLWGKLQGPDYGIRASLFYYQPQLHPGYYTIRGGWDKERTETTWRAYNYPHQAAVYWALYRLARNHPGLVKAHPWQWYLRQAYETTMAMRKHCGPTLQSSLAQFGLMVGSVFAEILGDLQHERWVVEASQLDAYMRERAQHWNSLRYPYGSEMPWDSTGQEEVYTWCRYFGYNDKATTTVNAVLAYDPAIPSWAYNGSARRYFDAPVNGTRWPLNGRMTNHYGASLNAIPVLEEYLRRPDDLHLLRVGYAGMSSVLANIDAQGHGSYGFDATPAILEFDPYTADYGVAFYGYAHGAGAYVVRSPEYGLLGFGCRVSEQGGAVTVKPTDAFRRRVFLAQARLELRLECGAFERVTLDRSGRNATLVLTPGQSGAPARLRLPDGWRPDRALPMERGCYVLELGPRPTTVRVRMYAIAVHRLQGGPQ